MSVFFLSYPLSILFHSCIQYFFLIFCFQTVSNLLHFCAHHFSHPSFLILHHFHLCCFWCFSKFSCIVPYLPVSFLYVALLLFLFAILYDYLIFMYNNPLSVSAATYVCTLWITVLLPFLLKSSLPHQSTPWT